MKTETGFRTADVAQDETRRSGSDRRAEDERRRSSKGLFELRARREGMTADRRQKDRRGPARSWLAFWRKDPG